MALELPLDWKKLARRLKMMNAEIDLIEKKKEEHSERAYEMLLKWKRANGKGANFKVLYDALRHRYVGRRDLAEKYCCVP